MKKNYMILLSVLFAFSANAQLSGYLGKRFVIGYSNYFFPGLKGPGPNQASHADEFSFCINNVNCLNIEYVYAQRRMVCFSAQYLRTGIAYNRGVYGPFTFDPGNVEYPYPNQTKYTGDYTKPALLSSVNFGLGIKWFKKGFIAPIGKYRKLEFLFLMETVKYDNTHFSMRDPNNGDAEIPYTDGNGIYKYKDVALVYSFGNQRAIGDKFILDYGLRFAYSPAVNIVSFVNGETANDISGVYKYTSRSRIFREQLINIHLGIGFLAF